MNRKEEEDLQSNAIFLISEQVNMTAKLGNGEFGEVFKGTLTLGPLTKPVEVAIKTLKGKGMSADDR